MARPNSKNVGAKGTKTVVEGLSQKRAMSGPGLSRPIVQPNPNEKPKRVRHRDIWEQVHALGLQFFFQDSKECNVDLVREAYANWRCMEEPNEIYVRGVVVLFTNNALCEFWGTLVESEHDSGDGDSDHAPTGIEYEEDDDEQSPGTVGDANYIVF
ncbi:hypothetical protein RND71_015695 [Anisodus tanguticus]|uniref:Uncharacterized protein n=1 Tax=Anisodus tanguticus TaxID=243964 RepID=A0AAE1S7K9_9SOLA|nr:hypothetical protein RND71_015695 [Anisodus tanguticus]